MGGITLRANPFFSKENRQRIDPGHGRDLAARAGIKVFWFFSSEKNTFPASKHRPAATTD
jgi:hypothetical protein